LIEPAIIKRTRRDFRVYQYDKSGNRGGKSQGTRHQLDRPPPLGFSQPFLPNKIDSYSRVKSVSYQWEILSQRMRIQWARGEKETRSGFLKGEGVE
jgi:hypothetical protein